MEPEMLPGLSETVLEIAILLSIGILLKRLRIIDDEFSKKLLSVSINLLLPIVVFSSFATAKISSEDRLLPAIGLMINLILLAVAYSLTKNLSMDKARKGAFLLGCSTLSIGIIGLPFVELFFKAEGVAVASLLEIGNSVYVFLIAPLVASSFNPSTRGKSFKSGVKRLFTKPYILSIILGLINNLLEMKLPELGIVVSIVSFINLVVILIAAGALMNFPPKSLFRQILVATMVKIPVGRLIGLTIAGSFGLTSQTSKVTIMVATLPPAFTTIVHASSENLDLEFITILLGFTLAIGITVITLYGLFLSF